MTKMMTNTTYEAKVSILANTYHFEFGEENSILGEWFEDFADNCLLARFVDDGYCVPSEKGKASIHFAFDKLCEELNIEDDEGWTDYKHWTNQFKD